MARVEMKKNNSENQTGGAIHITMIISGSATSVVNPDHDEFSQSCSRGALAMVVVVCYS